MANNSGFEEVAKKFRNLAKLGKKNCKYLFCPPVFVKIDLLGDRTFKKGQFWYKAPYLLKLTNRDIKTSNSLNKPLKRAFGGRHFEHEFLSKYQTKPKTNFRSEISMKFATFECIVGPKCENRYFKAMFTVAHRNNFPWNITQPLALDATKEMPAYWN